MNTNTIEIKIERICNVKIINLVTQWIVYFLEDKYVADFVPYPVISL